MPTKAHKLRMVPVTLGFSAQNFLRQQRLALARPVHDVPLDALRAALRAHGAIAPEDGPDDGSAS